MLGLICAGWPASAQSHDTGPVGSVVAGSAPLPAWTVTRSAATGPVMSRAIEPVTVDFRLIADEYNLLTPTLSLSVAGCAGEPWSFSDSVNPVGETTAARGAVLRDAILKGVADAPRQCGLPADLATQLLEGLDAAYARFEAARQ